MGAANSTPKIEETSNLAPMSHSLAKSYATFLPVELLSLIFIIACSGKRLPKWTPSRQAMAYSHVCLFWRNVVLSTPSFWCNIHLEDGNWEQFAIRSMPLPIRISASLTTQLWTNISRNMSWCRGHAHRVEHLSLKGPNSLINGITTSLGSDLASLCTVDLASDEIVRIPMKTPNLRILKLSNVDFDLEPLANLSEISLVNSDIHSVETFVSLLSRCSQLRYLHISGGNWESVPAARVGTRVALPSLERMKIQDIGSDYLVNLLGHVSIPASTPILRQGGITDGGWREFHISVHAYTLQMGCDFTNYIEITDDIVFLDMSSVFILIGNALDMSSVTRITIRTTWFEANGAPTIDAWRTLLSSISGIDYLSLCVPRSWMETFLRALWPTGVEALGIRLCPVLRQLSLSLDFHNPIDEINVAELLVELLSRSAPKSLEILKISFGDESVVARLMGMVDSVIRGESLLSCNRRLTNRM